MRMKIRILIPCLLVITCVYGQMEDYSYKRKINGINQQWHNIILPDELFGKIGHSLHDIRVFGIKATKDTIEAPYILRYSNDQIFEKQIIFKTVNSSYTNKGFFISFEVPGSEEINQIDLDFLNENFDWFIRLEGSQNQDEWFTIIDKYRILGIKNQSTNFRFTTVNFPKSKYKYIRLFINSREQPKLTHASITLNTLAVGNLKNYTIKSLLLTDQKEKKLTELEISLHMPVPVSQIKVNVKDSFDYYRPATIQYLADSIKTEQGWIYHYNTVSTGALNSQTENEFNFKDQIAQKFKITILNHDNAPLRIDAVEAGGYQYELQVRFTEYAKYYLAYGYENATEPDYDIERFKEKIPNPLQVVELGNEEIITKQAEKTEGPLFENENWLWLAMTILIILLGWFTLSMMKKKD